MNLPGVEPRELALRVFKHQGGEELLIHQAEQEIDTVGLANDFIEAADGDTITAFLGPDERAAQLTRGIVSLVEGDLEGFYAQEYARVRCSSDPADVLPYVDLEVDEWLDQKETWHERLGSPEDYTTDEAAEVVVANTFGVSLDEFVSHVVAWNDGDDAKVIERFLAGDPYDAEWRVFVGHRTGHQGLRWARGELLD